MAKDKISITVDSSVLSAIDADATSSGLNRSEMIERAMRNEHLRLQLEQYRNVTVPKLGIDEYAESLYVANRRLEP
ncbi:ribbon-helix-helix domain-containing protein [Tsukamurella soli]|uniref:ribbon-helix-helix domain-containing protein n=1 Tax=Tsukamurella soli TaxID=644556 RepID=UPI0031E8113D